MHPYQVVLGDIAKQSAFVLAKGHAMRDNIDQDLGIHGAKNTLFSTQRTSVRRIEGGRSLGLLAKTT
jgi:hypothetical protein